MSKNVSFRYRIPFKTKALNIGRRIFMLRIFENWLARRTVNKKVSSFWCKLIPPEYLYPKNSYRVVKINGAMYKLDISNVVDHGAFWGFQDKTISFFLSQFDKRYTIFDVGANIGIISVSAAERSKQVISIEPDKTNFARLTENLGLNNITNVTTLNIGLGSRKEVKKLYKVVESNPGMNRIIDGELDLPYNEIQIETLDSIAQTLNISKIDVIKIDTEGYEMNILKGSNYCIDKFKPAMMLEVDNSLLQAQSSSAVELLSFIKEKGYNIYDIINEKAIDKLDGQIPSHFDVWCSPMETN
jgi:FkbM family methyltransferase